MEKYNERKPLTIETLDKFKEGNTIFIAFDSWGKTPKPILEEAKNRKIDIIVIDYDFKFEQNFEVKVNLDKQLQILARWAKYRPEVVEKILKAKRCNCPFPNQCKIFPCDAMDCNADNIMDGHAYRMS
jgi:hypothetical protein